MRYKVTVSYDGTNFKGWQIQPDSRTVQQEIEKALSSINKEKTNIHASGRTDAGVHAIAQVFHFNSDLNLDEGIWIKAINGHLPWDIRVTNVEKVSDSFHARYHACSKTYRYIINTDAYDVFNRNYIYQYNKPLNVEKMNQVASLLSGTHNFLSFNSTPTFVIEDQTRTIEAFDIEETDGIITVTIKGNGFLKHMIRMIVATCIAYCENKILLEDIKGALVNPNRDLIPYNISGCGLYLVNVDYKMNA